MHQRSRGGFFKEAMNTPWLSNLSKFNLTSDSYDLGVNQYFPTLKKFGTTEDMACHRKRNMMGREESQAILFSESSPVETLEYDGSMFAMLVSELMGS
ncbi:hypothetical protein WICPIJ_009736 [Wickerhamomyces pijperi]|uniref:Uncharacterized protein n=1 Tax=Wickerhamomyces pijperi TaxID=599730 RepID=A0A9P8PK12_WICPI|nr:hypothetical protein WICPIJ_009736 [Wickerhamomyces pijperi]